MSVKVFFHENFDNAPAKVKFTRAIYFLLVLPLVVVAFPVYLAGTFIEIALDKLKEWLW